MNNFIDEFKLNDNIFYLNHAAVSPWPKRTATAVINFANENVQQGSRQYLQWLQTEQDLREKLRWLINAKSTNDIALLKSTSEALSVVAYGLNWKKGDNVVILEQEFPSNRIVWESLRSRDVDTKLVDIRQKNAEDALIKACNSNTRIMSVSAVQFASGLKLNLEKLGTFCRQNNILFCVDAIQQLGAQAFDVQNNGAHFVMADAHKWMMGPEGLALFYCDPVVREQLQLQQYGWHMVEQHFDFDNRDWAMATSARRFECGSANTLGTFAFNASLSLIRDAGIDAISNLINRNITYMIEQFSKHQNLQILIDDDPDKLSGIFVFRHKHINNNELYEHLLDHGVVCALRGGGIRFSPHFYNSTEEIGHVLDLILHLKG